MPCGLLAREPRPAHRSQLRGRVVAEKLRRALDAVTLALTPTSRRVFQPKGRNASPKYFAVGAGKADNRSSPLSAGASSFSPNRSGGGAAGGKREWKSPLLGD